MRPAVAERTQPKRTAIDTDLCDHWILQSDHRCTAYWHHIVTLDEPVEVGGHTMFGTYPAGTWHFCNTHHRIFERDRKQPDE